MNNFELICPFGPRIYRSTLDKKVFQSLLNISEDARRDMGEMQDTGYTNGAYVSLPNVELFNAFYTELKNHFMTYIEQCKNKKIDYKTFDVTIEESMWVNFQRKNDYNSLHVHEYSKLSAVIFLKIPKELKEELSKWTGKASGRTGMIEFVFGMKNDFSPGTYTFLPEEGEIIVFPSYLLHQVYAFKSDVERWTINVNMVGFNFQHLE
jgi:uncharacterized protein (TIGR02466 family)